MGGKEKGKERRERRGGKGRGEEGTRTPSHMYYTGLFTLF